MMKTLTLLAAVIFSSLTYAGSGTVGSASNVVIRGNSSMGSGSGDESINAGATEYIIILSTVDSTLRAIGDTNPDFIVMMQGVGSVNAGNDPLFIID